MDKELKEIYKWLREPILPSAQIPTRWQWYYASLLKDMDKRLTKLEKKDD